MNAERYIYSIYWQAKTPPDSDKALFDALASLEGTVRKEINDHKIDFEKGRTELLNRQVQGLRAGLSQFLSTPLKSDTEEINTLIYDSLSRVASAYFGDIHPLIRPMTQLLMDSKNIPGKKKGNAKIRSLIVRGKKELQSRGISFSKNTSNVFVLEFIVSDLTIIQSIREIVEMIATGSLYNNEYNIQPVLSSLSVCERWIEPAALEYPHRVYINLHQRGDENVLSSAVESFNKDYPDVMAFVTTSQPLSVTNSHGEIVLLGDLKILPLQNLLETFFSSLGEGEIYSETASIFIGERITIKNAE